MKESNDIKRAFVIDQNEELEHYIVRLLKETEFCVSSQRRQRVAF